MENAIINVEIKNFFHLNISCDLPHKKFLIAYYLIKGKEVIEKTHYTRNYSHKFNLDERGPYRVRVYIKDLEGNIKIETSEVILFEGFEEKLTVHINQVAIIGVSKRTAFLKRVIENFTNVLCFVDLSSQHVNKDFFDLPIKSIEEVQKIQGVTLLSFEEQLEIDAPFEVIHLEIGHVNFLTRIMNKVDAISLYRIARSCYEDGLIFGANYIRDFIFNKYNSFIPYTAEIGEGTRLGYGGIGVVIHSKAKIGQNCLIGQNVTIGSRGVRPIIGENVYISPGSKCIGGKIGDNVIVGANSVVTKEIPDNCVIAGVPAKIISQDLSNYQQYINRKK